FEDDKGVRGAGWGASLMDRQYVVVVRPARQSRQCLFSGFFGRVRHLGVFRHWFQVQLRLRVQRSLDTLRIVHARHLEQYLVQVVRSLPLYGWLGNAERIYTILDYLHGLVGHAVAYGVLFAYIEPVNYGVSDFAGPPASAKLGIKDADDIGILGPVRDRYSDLVVAGGLDVVEGQVLFSVESVLGRVCILLGDLLSDIF